MKCGSCGFDDENVEDCFIELEGDKLIKASKRVFLSEKQSIKDDWATIVACPKCGTIRLKSYLVN